MNKLDRPGKKGLFFFGPASGNAGAADWARVALFSLIMPITSWLSPTSEEKVLGKSSRR